MITNRINGPFCFIRGERIGLAEKHEASGDEKDGQDCGNWDPGF